MSRRESISQNKEHKKEHNKVGTWVTAAGVRPRKGKESTTLFLLTRDTNVLKCILHCRYGVIKTQLLDKPNQWGHK